MTGVRLAMVLSALCAATAAAQDEHEFQFSRVAGNDIAWSCQGTGAPTIALIARGGLSAHDSFDLYENEHRALQPTLAKLSTNAEYRIARYSSHMFDEHDPWLVIDEIKALLKRVESVE